MNSAQIRVIHDVANVPKVDVYLDSKIILSGTPFIQNSGNNPKYMGVPAGPHTVDIKVSPSLVSSPSLISRMVSLPTGPIARNFSVVAHGDVKNPSTLDILLLEDLSECPLGKSNHESNHGSVVIFVHSAATVPAVDVYLNVNKSLSNRAYGTATEYLPVPAGIVDVRITVAGETHTKILSGSVEFGPNSIYTIYVAGLVGNNTAPVGIVMFQDSSGACYVMH